MKTQKSKLLVNLHVPSANFCLSVTFTLSVEHPEGLLANKERMESFHCDVAPDVPDVLFSY